MPDYAASGSTNVETKKAYRLLIPPAGCVSIPAGSFGGRYAQVGGRSALRGFRRLCHKRRDSSVSAS